MAAAAVMLGVGQSTTRQKRDLMASALFECPDGDPHHVQATPDDWNVEGLARFVMSSRPRVSGSTLTSREPIPSSLRMQPVDSVSYMRTMLQREVEMLYNEEPALG